MRCERPLGHADLVRGLWRAAVAGRLAHALLFAGPDGVGKFLAAQWLTLGLFCESGPGEPCGVCGPCKRLKADSHPDVFVLDPVALEEEEIKVALVAPRAGESGPNVLDFLSLLPMEGGWRVVIVREAERMNANAQNALLKTLEEPGERTVLVLETAFEDRLLATVRSRCMKVAFAALAADDARAVLAREGLAGPEAERLARWSGGAPGRALALRARGAEALRDLWAGVLAGDLDPLAAAARVAEHAGDFGGGTARREARERARTFIDLGLAVLADLRRARAGLDPSGLAHGDLAAAGPLAEAPGERELAALLEAGLCARQDIEANLAPDAVLEELLLFPAGLARRAGR